MEEVNSKGYIKGFKAFLPGLKTQFGSKLEVGKYYHTNEPIEFNKHGFHFCERLEDTLHFFTQFESDVDICEVIGFGDIKKMDNDYYGYYDMYVASNIKIVRHLSKIEILNLYKKLLENPYVYDIRISRFLAYYQNLTEEDYQYLGIHSNQFRLRYY